MKRLSDFTVLGVQIVLSYLYLHYSGEVTTNNVVLIFGITTICAAILVALKAFWDIKTNFAVAPKPHNSASLITSGIYSKIRHPMYSAVIFASFGYLLIRYDLLMLAFFLIIILFLIAKIYFEDRFLTRKYDKYEQYKKQTKALIPYVW